MALRAGAVSHGGFDAPERHGDRRAETRAHPVDQPPGERHHEGVSQLESEDNPSVIRFAPAKLFFECRLQQSEDLAVDIIDGSGEE